MFKEGEYFFSLFDSPSPPHKQRNPCTSDTFPDSIGEPVKMLKQVIYNVKRNDVPIYRNTKYD